MITENLTKSQFIVEILNRDVKNIYRAQMLIAQHNVRLTGKNLKETKRSGKKLSERSGRLYESLSSPSYKIVGVNGNFDVDASLPLHTRFLDMKDHGNWMIYNRQVWGILYNNSQRDIKYGYGKQIHDNVGDALEKAFTNAQK